MKGRKKHLKPEKAAYLKGDGRKMWRVVNGAIADAFAHHPDYLTSRGTKGRTAQRSVAKRVTGAVLSYLEQSKWGRSGDISGVCK